MTKNLFDYATKELSQDAFLRWLFENWNSEQEDVKVASRTLLNKLLDMEVDFDKVKSLKTIAQERKIDLLVDIKSENAQYLIVIEDKTYTRFHDNQLINYRQYSDTKFTNNIIKYIYYKSNIIDIDEDSEVKNLEWTVFDISKIYDVFSNLSIKPKNNILFDYVEYIKRIYVELTKKLPDCIYDWNINHWINFYYNNNLVIPKNIHFGYGNFRGQYIYLVFNIINGWKHKPYGEVRSRDFGDNKSNPFLLRILMYDTVQEDLDRYLDEWKLKFGNSDLFILQNYRQQLAINSISNEIFSKEDLERELQKYINEYEKLMS